MTWTNESMAETGAVVCEAAAEGLVGAIQRDLDHVAALVLKLRAADREVARYQKRGILAEMTNYEHSIAEIRDLWLNSRGADGSDWEQALLAVYNFGVAGERARIRRELIAESADIMYGPSDSALRDALNRICPE